MAEAIDMMYCVQCDSPYKKGPSRCPKCKSNLVHTKVGWRFASGRAIFTIGSLVVVKLIYELGKYAGESWKLLFAPLTGLTLGLLVSYWAYYFCGFGSIFFGDEEALTFRSAFYRRWPIENIPDGYSRPTLKQQLLWEIKTNRIMLIIPIIIMIFIFLFNL